MLETRPEAICLYAVLPTAKVEACRASLRGLRLLRCGPVTAVAGKPWDDLMRAAMRHDRVVGRVLRACSAVVPLRLGVVLESEAQLQHLLELNLQVLTWSLERFEGRVEMSLKVKLPARMEDAGVRLPLSLEPIRALAPASVDRQERVKRTESGRFFEGSYLVARPAVEFFWQAVEQLRQAAPELPIMGSGPWAAYSFCDFALQPVQTTPGALAPGQLARGALACAP